jgi:hypothetical protein
MCTAVPRLLVQDLLSSYIVQLIERQRYDMRGQQLLADAQDEAPEARQQHYRAAVSQDMHVKFRGRHVASIGALSHLMCTAFTRSSS